MISENGKIKAENTTNYTAKRKKRESSLLTQVRCRQLSPAHTPPCGDYSTAMLAHTKPRSWHSLDKDGVPGAQGLDSTEGC